jgi:hypothetical protein
MADEPQQPEVQEPEAPQVEQATDNPSDSVPQAEPEVGVVPQAERVDSADAELERLRAEEQAFRWQASEYVHHHKSAAWYAGLAAFTAALVGLAVVLHYWTSIALFGVMAVAVVIYANKPPRTMTYELSPDGLKIDDKDYHYKEFRSFGVLPDVDWHSIDLEPAKRFSPRITVLFGDDDLKTIVGHLELHLPRVDRKPDLVEQATRYLRF